MPRSTPDRRGHAARRARPPERDGRAAARCEPWRSRDQRRDGAGQARRDQPARAGRGARRRTGEAGRGRRGRGRRAGLHQPAADRRQPGATSWPRSPRAGADYGRSTLGDGHHRQHRICLRQPDRADAHGALPRRGGRRCARQPARIRRAPGDPRILRQRRRRAGRRARPLGAPALPRGAGRGRRRRSPRGCIPAIIWSPVGQALAPEFGDRFVERARGRMAGAVPHPRGRGDDGDDPRRPRAARHPPRPVRVGGRAAGGGQARGGRGGAARARPRL